MTVSWCVHGSGWAFFAEADGVGGEAILGISEFTERVNENFVFLGLWLRLGCGSGGVVVVAVRVTLEMVVGGCGPH